MPPSLRPESDFPQLQISTHPQMHGVTEKELLAFLKNPCDLIGKQFELRGGRKHDLFYKVVKLNLSYPRLDARKGTLFGYAYHRCNASTLHFPTSSSPYRMRNTCYGALKHFVN